MAAEEKDVLSPGMQVEVRVRMECAVCGGAGAVHHPDEAMSPECPVCKGTGFVDQWMYWEDLWVFVTDG